MNWFHRKMMAAVTLMSVAGPALADKYLSAPGGNSTWTVYAFGNAQALADAFRALNNFATSSTFQSIVGLIAMIGVLAVGMSSGFSSMVARKFIGYIVGVFIVTYLFFGVGAGGPVVVSVEVMDTVDQTWVAPVTVPAVVGVPASIISNAGMEITRQIEASFPLPDELKMSNGAPFNLSAALLADASRARITDQNLASSLAYYVQDCFVIGVAQGQVDANTLINSTDFINDIRVNLATVYVSTLLADPVGQNSVVTCNEAWTHINNALTAQGVDADSFLNNASAWPSTPALSVMNSSADAMASQLTNNQVTSGGSIVKQAAVLSAFTGAFKQSAAATGNSEFLTALGTTQALQTQVTGWLTGAEIFNRIMGYVFAIIQVFVFAIMPLVLAAALVPGLGLALLKNFGQILLWLAIWQPMLAIVNFIIISMQQAELGGALHAGGQAYNFTMANMGIVSERTATMRAAGSFIGTMVPALAWALVKGSVDFSSFIASATGERFAQTAANTAVTGNYSLNQASMDSFTANKNSIAATSALGHGQMVDSGVGTQKLPMGGIGAPDAGGGAQSGNVSYQGARNLNDNGARQSQASQGDSNTATFGRSLAQQLAMAAAYQAGGGDLRNFLTNQTASANMGASAAMFSGKGGKPSPNPADGRFPGRQGDGDGEAPPAEYKSGALDKAKEFANTYLPTIQAGVQGSGMANASVGNDWRKGDVKSTNASDVIGVNQGDVKSEVLARTDSANTGQGYQGGQTQSYSTVASLNDRFDVARRELVGGNFFTAARYGDENSEISRAARGLTTEGAQEAHAAAQPGAFDQAYKNRHELVAGEKGTYATELDRRKAETEQKAKEEQAKVRAEKTRIEQEADAAKGPASQNAFVVGAKKVGETMVYAKELAENYVDKTKENAGAAMDTVVDAAHRAKDFVSGRPGEDSREAPGATNPTPHQPAEQRNRYGRGETAPPAPQAMSHKDTPVPMADAGQVGGRAQNSEPGLDGLFNGDKPAQAAPVQLADARPGQARETTQAEPEPQGEGGDPYGAGNRNSSVA